MIMEIIKENGITRFVGFGITDRAVLVNDMHISRESISDFRDNWSECVDVCVKKGARVMMVGGDLFQSRHAQPLIVLSTIKWAMEYANSKNIFVILANGNHDKVDQESWVGYCHMYDKHENVYVIDKWGVIETPNANIFILAYFPEQGTLMDKINEIESSDEFSNGKRNVLYAHVGVMGALGRDNPTEMDKSAFSHFDATYMGHYHDRSKVEGAEIYYIGSSRQFNYGEDTDKGYNICDSSGYLTFVQNQVNTRYATIRLAYDDLPNIGDKIEEVRSKHPTECLIKAVIEVDSKDKGNVDRQHLINSGVSRIEVVNLVEQKSTEEESKKALIRYDGEQIVDTYKEYCGKINVSPKVGVEYLTK